MSSKKTKAANRENRVSAMFGGRDVSTIEGRLSRFLAMDNRLRKPETACTTATRCSLHSAKATVSKRAKKPFIYVK